jgi:hypothetical protein
VDELSNTPASSSSTIAHSSTLKTSRRKRSHFDTIDPQLLEILKPKEVVEDEDELFMKSLVPQLKKLREDQKVEAKIRMQTVLFELHFGRQPNVYPQTFPSEHLQTFNYKYPL